MTRSEGVPVYVICGFLDSGKTQFINEMLADPGFTEGERTLLLCCEDGAVDYDDALLKKSNTVMREIETAEEMSDAFMSYDAEIMPERVIVEYNAMWMLSALYDADKPEEWELGQIVTLIDATSFDLYIKNMANYMADGIREADLILFNRCTGNTPMSQYRRRAKALNGTARIYFELTDGTTSDGVSDEDLPYDMTKSPIVIKDEDFGTFYLDSMEHPDRYDGKKLCLRGTVAYANDLPKNCYILSRRAMTCCAQDIGGIGYVTKYAGEAPSKNRYVEIECVAEKGFSVIHGRDWLILVQKSIKFAVKPKDDIVNFT